MDLDFVFAEETLLVLCLTYIYAESDKSRIVRLVADAEQILIDNSQNRIGSGLKNIRVRTLVHCSACFQSVRFDFPIPHDAPFGCC